MILPVFVDASIPLKSQKKHPISLVVFRPTPLKNMKVSWDDYSQYISIYGFSTQDRLASGSQTFFQSGWWCNNHLEKYEFVNGKDDIPCMYYGKFSSHV